MKTQSYWRNYNMAFRDKDYSPAKGVSLWETCPQLALLDPGVGYTYMEDFFNYLAADWQVDIVGVSTATLQDAAGGILRFNTAAAEGDGVQIQKLGEAFLPAAGHPIWFEARIRVVTAAKHIESDFLVGLAVTDADPFTALADGIYFLKVDGSALVSAFTENTNVPTETAGVLGFASTTWYKFGFWYDGIANCYFYVNGVLVATHTTNIPTTELQPTFSILNGEAGAVDWDIDYFKVVQIR